MKRIFAFELYTAKRGKIRRADELSLPFQSIAFQAGR